MVHTPSRRLLRFCAFPSVHVEGQSSTAYQLLHGGYHIVHTPSRRLLRFAPSLLSIASCVATQYVERAASSDVGAAAEGRYFNSESAADLMVVDGYIEGGQSFAGGKGGGEGGGGGGEGNDDSSGSLSGPPHKVSPIPPAGKDTPHGTAVSYKLPRLHLLYVIAR